MKSLNKKSQLLSSVITALASILTVFAIAYNSLNPKVTNYITFTGSRYMFLLEFAIIIGLGLILGLRNDKLSEIVTNKQYYLGIFVFFLFYALFTYGVHLGIVGSYLDLPKALSFFAFIWKLNNPTFVLFWLLLLSPIYAKWFTQTNKLVQWLLVAVSFVALAAGLFFLDHTNRLNLLYLASIPGVLFSFSLGALVNKLPNFLQKLQESVYLPIIIGILIFGSLNFDINIVWWNTALSFATGLLLISNYSVVLLLHLLITLAFVAVFELARANQKKHPQALILALLLPISYYVLQASNYGFKLTTVLTAHGSIWLSLMNLSILLAIYMILVAIFKRVYLSVGIYSLFLILASYANMQKVLLRNEPITPLDLKNIAILPELISMINVYYLIGIIVGLVVLFSAIWFVQHKFNLKLQLKWPWRVGIVAVSALYLAFWVNFLPTQTVSWNTSGSHVAKSAVLRLSRYRTITMIVPIEHYRDNGSLIGFASMLKVTAMDKPANYSEQTVKKIAAKYTAEAQKLNAKRDQNINDQTIIYILSESLANPNRVPGVQLSANPLQNITQYQQDNKGGLFFSNGYGGGTANIEFEALTSLSMNNFSPSMSIPYSFLVPQLNYFPTIINAFAERNAVHPYTGQTYERNKAFKKFGFQHFYAKMAGTDKVKHTASIGNSPYTSDAASYENVLDLLKKSNKNQIIQLSTMQNHMPYYANYYSSKAIETKSNLLDTVKPGLATYTEGIRITDQETAKFINEISKMKKKVTVVLYGDHLPGIYTWKENNDEKHEQYDNILHQADYFIYSNFEEENVGKQVISPNMINPLLFAKTDAKVSPYYALMTDVALDTPAAELGKYMDDAGNYIGKNKLSKKQQQILSDYNMIMYDLTSGKKYLNGTSFYKIPGAVK